MSEQSMLFSDISGFFCSFPFLFNFFLLVWLATTYFYLSLSWFPRYLNSSEEYALRTQRTDYDFFIPCWLQGTLLKPVCSNSSVAGCPCILLVSFLALEGVNRNHRYTPAGDVDEYFTVLSSMFYCTCWFSLSEMSL